MTRRTSLLAGLTVATLAAVAVVITLVVTSQAKPVNSSAEDAAPSTGTVERGPLAAALSLHGTVSFRARPDGSPYAAVNRSSGTYTHLPDPGDRISCGGELYRVDDQPVLLLCGTFPAYRDMQPGDSGQDVRQLNQNLHAMGLDAQAGVTVDPAGTTFTSSTRRALGLLQRNAGSAATGRLALGAAVVLPEAVRVTKVAVELGAVAQPGGPVLTATSDVPVVRVALDPSQQGDLAANDPVRITLPDNTSVTGKVIALGEVTQAAAGQDGAPGPSTVPAYLSLDDPGRARSFEDAAVTVTVTTAGVRDALSVPVTALVGKAGGGFAVEVVRADGRRDLVEVTLGLVDDTAGRVQVEGDLTAGDHVLVPSL
ncbi:MAG: hypothetical protein JWQ74_5 [Marmoricola sp.]|nr:hypothetical protein [Marmoricola sp.]